MITTAEEEKTTVPRAKMIATMKREGNKGRKKRGQFSLEAR